MLGVTVSPLGALTQCLPAPAAVAAAACLPSEPVTLSGMLACCVPLVCSALQWEGFPRKQTEPHFQPVFLADRKPRVAPGLCDSLDSGLFPHCWPVVAWAGHASPLCPCFVLCLGGVSVHTC